MLGLGNLFVFLPVPSVLLSDYENNYSYLALKPFALHRYLVYYPRTLIPQIAYAIIRSQNPKGISDYLVSGLKKLIPKRPEQP